MPMMRHKKRSAPSTPGGGGVGGTQPSGRPVFAAPNSFYNWKLASNAPIASDSANAVSRLVEQWRWTTKTTPSIYYDGQYQSSADANDPYGIAVWDVPSGQATQKVWSTRTKGADPASSGSSLTLQQIFDLGVPMPSVATAGKQIQAAGSDGSAMVRRGNELWGFWRLKPLDYSNPPAWENAGPAPAGYQWTCAQGGYVKDVTTHPGFYTSGPDWGITAMGSIDIVGRLTIDDWTLGEIRHVMSLALYDTDFGKVNPATRYDTFNFTGSPDASVNAYRIAEGTRFRLPATFDESAITNFLTSPFTLRTGGTNTTVFSSAIAAGASLSDPTSEASLRMVLRAIRDYGFVVNDSSGIFGWGVEGSQPVGTPYSHWPTNPAHWGNFGQIIGALFGQMQKTAPELANAHM